MALFIGGLSLVLAFAIAAVVVRALRRSRRMENAPRTTEDENNSSRQVATSFDQKAEEDERFKAQERARHQAEEEARAVAEQETQRKAEEEARRRADEEARLAAEQETQRRAEEDARVAAEQEAHRKVQEKARLATEQEAQSKAEEEARVATAQKERQAAEEKQTGIHSEGDAPPTKVIGPAAPLRAPHQYRPIARFPAGPRGPAPASAEREARDRAMPLEVRLVFERAGFCRVSLLPRRAAGMPVELAVKGSGDPPELLALQDEWYQDIALPNLGQLLREGIEWVGSLPEDHQIRLSLSGRELYVLAGHSELNGFVSTPRLILGEEHVVLCVAERLSEVRAAIALTGSTEPTLLSSSSGVPVGWTGLRGVVPRTPIAPNPAGDILDALRPLADVKIALEGGIRIERQTWLNGFPPTVRLRGDTSAIGAVTIDGHEATFSPGGSYVVPGWDSLGEHSVWCTSDSRTYAIRNGPEDWESWDAYIWPAWRPRRRRHAVASRAICGVLVRPPRAVRSDGRVIVVPASNPVLIGASPGEIEICTPHSDVRAGLCVGFPWFEPVWAIPANVRRRDNRTTRVLLIGAPRPVAEGEQPSMHTAGRSLFRRGRSWGGNAWCTSIIKARRMGLETEPSRAEIADLWKTYERCAKLLRRSGR